MNFSMKIKEILTLKGLSSAELAKGMEYTPQYVSDLLLGKRRWNETTITKACKYLGFEFILLSKNSCDGDKEGVGKF